MSEGEIERTEEAKIQELIDRVRNSLDEVRSIVEQMKNRINKE